MRDLGKNGNHPITLDSGYLVWYFRMKTYLKSFMHGGYLRIKCASHNCSPCNQAHALVPPLVTCLGIC